MPRDRCSLVRRPFDRTAALGAALLVAAAAAPSAALPAGPPRSFALQLDASRSGLAGEARFLGDHEGTLRGAWDAVANPSGARTKPGLFGTFNAGENLPVPVTLDLLLEGPLDLAAAGGLRVTVDAAAESAVVSGLHVDFLAAGPAVLPAVGVLTYESFRTREPTAVFPSLAPLEIPLGEVRLTTLAAAQTGGPVAAALDPLGGNAYSFAAVVPVDLAGSFAALGDEQAFGPLSAALLLAGTLVIDGSRAELRGTAPTALAGTFPAQAELPTIPFELPTFLPPGGAAGVDFALTLTGLTIDVDAQFRLQASGTSVPLPGSWALLAAASPALGTLWRTGARCRKRR